MWWVRHRVVLAHKSFAKQEQERQAAQSKDRQQAEVVDVGPQRGLLTENLADHRVRLLKSGSQSTLQKKEMIELVERLAEGGIIRREMSDHHILVALDAAHQQRRDHGDAEARAHVSSEAVQSGAFAHLFVRESGHRQRGQRDKEKTIGKSVDDVRPDDVPHADLKIEIAQHEKRHGANHHADAEQQAAIDAPDEPPGNNQRENGAEGARRNGQAALIHRVIQEVLKEQRQQRRRAVNDDADQTNSWWTRHKAPRRWRKAKWKRFGIVCDRRNC